MRTNLLAAAFAALLSVPAFAQVEVKISFPWIAPPPLVFVEPGIQVVPDYPEEVFFVDEWYWVRRDGRWLRTRDVRTNWIYVSSPPSTLIRLPPGKYKHWKANKAKGGKGERYIAAPPPAQSVRAVSAPPPADSGRRVDAPPGRGGGKKHGKKD